MGGEGLRAPLWWLTIILLYKYVSLYSGQRGARSLSCHERQCNRRIVHHRILTDHTLYILDLGPVKTY